MTQYDMTINQQGQIISEAQRGWQSGRRRERVGSTFHHHRLRCSRAGFLCQLLNFPLNSDQSEFSILRLVRMIEACYIVIA